MNLDLTSNLTDDAMDIFSYYVNRRLMEVSVQKENDKQVILKIQNRDNDVLFVKVRKYNLLDELKKGTKKIKFGYFEQTFITSEMLNKIDDITLSFCIFSKGFILLNQHVSNLRIENSIFRNGLVEFGNLKIEKDLYLSTNNFGSGNKRIRGCTFDKDSRLFFDKNICGSGELGFSRLTLNGSDLKITHNKIYKCDVTFSQNTIKAKEFSISSNGFEESSNFYFLDTKTFDTNININRIHFGGKRTIFKNIDFGTGKIYFNNIAIDSHLFEMSDITKSKGVLIFDDSHFDNKDMDLERLNFGKEVKTVFNKCHITCIAFVIHESYMNKLSFIRSFLQTNVSLSIKNLEHLIVRNSIIEKSFMCDKYQETESSPQEFIKFKELAFHSTVNHGQILISWHDNNVEKALESYFVKNKISQSDRAACYLLLNKNFSNLGREIDEDAAYVKYKLNSRMHKASKNIFYKFGKFGTDIKSIGFATIILIMLFALIYTGIYSDWNLEGILNNVYFSGITFFTIGYGDISPTIPIVKILTVLEGFTGITVMSYFTITVFRKVVR